MARSLTANAITEIAKRLGTEPINIIGIDWVGNGTEILYADRELTGVEAKILELSDVDEVIRVEGTNNSSSISIVLDDTDGYLKTIYNTTNLHKKVCTIYQYFSALALADKFTLFKGYINTPVVWNEGKRTLSFDIVTKIESEEVGFAPEEGQFTDVAPSAVGKVWPLCFGQVAHVPAVKTSDVIRGNIVTTIGIADATLPLKRKQLVYNLNYYTRAYAFYLSAMNLAKDIAREPIVIASDYLYTIKTEDGLKQNIEDYSGAYEILKEQLDKLLELINEAATPADAADVQAAIEALAPLVAEAKVVLDELNPRLDQIEATKEYLEIEVENAEYEFETIGKMRKTIAKLLEYILETAWELNKIDVAIAQQMHLNQTVFTVVNGHKFPQGTQIRLICKGMLLVGSFAGDIFTLVRIEPRYRNVAIGARLSTGVPTITTLTAYNTTVSFTTPDLTDINAFWINDATIELAGNYCLLSNGKIIKVSDQIGDKCFFDLEEIKTDDERNKPYQPAEEKDLTTWLWTQIATSGAREHTTKEQQRKLQESLGKDAKTSLKEMERRLEKLIELIPQAPTEDDKRAVQQAVYRDMGAYQAMIARLRFPRKDVAEAYRYISSQEFNNFLKLENLYRKEYWRALQPETIDVPGNYAVVGTDVTGSIVEVAPVILPSWLPFLKDQELSDLEAITAKLPNGQTIITDKIPRSTLWVAEGGSDVILDESYQEKYICNILPSTIKAVYANRAIDGYKRLVPVPSSYYVKNEADNYGGYTCTSITLRKPLKDYDDEQWEGELYVSLISSVGPNTALIIKWILETYTDLSIDATTFDYVEDRLTNYPSNFALFTKEDALSLVDKIAWQARCSVWLKFNTAYIRYLSEEPTSIDTIEQDDIEFESLSIEYTATEDLVTKFIGNWKTHYAQESDNKTILRHNIIKYGNLEKEYDFFIYNIESLVVKSATFWMIRLSNTWKRIKFKTFLTKLKIETLDAITLDLGDSLISTDPVLAIVDKVSYNSSEYGITMECWIPVRAGEMVVYDFAFPADIDVDTTFPTIEDIAAGIAGGDSRIPTGQSFALKSPNDIDYLEVRPKDYGSLHPSDAFDTLPNSPLAGYYEIEFQIERPADYIIPVQRGLANDDGSRSYTSPTGNSNDTSEGNNNWFGRVDEYLGSQLYKVSRSNGQIFSVYEIGFSASNITAVGTRVNVLWNRIVRRYEMIKPAVSGASMKEVKVDVHIDNLILCIESNGNYLWVAKPYSLQKDDWDGQQVELNGQTVFLSYTATGRTVSNDADEIEEQVIVPDYVAGEWITIWRTNTGFVDNEDNPVLWQDLNTAGRAWATIIEEEEA